MRTRVKGFLIAIAAAASVTALGAPSGAGEPAVFSHKAHIENGATCAECHGGKAAAGDRPALNPEHCKSCHDGAAPASRLAAGARDLKIAFPHALHTGAGECVDCHKATAEETQKAGAPILGPERCVACHAENGVAIAAADCAKCHGGNARDAKPAWHDGTWGETHGARSAEGAFQGHGRQCADCHGANACMTCHQERKPMSHRLHIEERGTDDCAYCHRTAAGALPTVAVEACADCHEGAPQSTDIGPRAKPMGLKFPHAAHEKGLQCVDCHLATIDGTQKAGAPVLGREDCESCHAAKGVNVGEKQCARCHGGAVERTRPASHDKAWRSRHGRAAEWTSLADHGAGCNLCHAERECVTCHLNMRPRDHTGLWRMRMHGVAASWDRDRCQQCHKTGACVSCHRRTKPLYHRGAWGEAHGLAAKVKSTEKCSVCHGRAWCARCHAGSH